MSTAILQYQFTLDYKWKGLVRMTSINVDHVNNCERYNIR